METSQRQRIDKWLWHARFARTRTAAQRLARSGHIRQNRVKVASPSRSVHLGDVLTIALGRGVRIVEVTGFAARRGSAEIAQKLYTDRTPAPVPSAARAATGSISGQPQQPAGKRPDKRDRRRLAALKRQSFD
ncbi:MAG: RNA-binding S4 domain-containing protein [Alphaproteobacteria bacterium]